MKFITDILRLYWRNRKITIPATIDAARWVYGKRFWFKKKWNAIFKKKIKQQ